MVDGPWYRDLEILALHKFLYTTIDYRLWTYLWLLPIRISADLTFKRIATPKTK